jgi:hypothetical protein
MKGTFLILLLLLTSCSREAEQTGNPRASSSGFSEADFAARVPDPDPASFPNITQPSDWGNPYLIIGPQTVTLQDRPAYSGRTIGRDQIGDLAGILLSLPAEAWPYGRIVGLQEQGVIGQNDGPRVVENREQVKAILARLHIEMYGWPSA